MSEKICYQKLASDSPHISLYFDNKNIQNSSHTSSFITTYYIDSAIRFSYIKKALEESGCKCNRFKKVRNEEKKIDLPKKLEIYEFGHSECISIKIRLNKGKNRICVKGRIVKIELWLSIISEENQDFKGILSVIVYTRLDIGHTVEQLLLWNGLLRRKSKSYDYINRLDPTIECYIGKSKVKLSYIGELVDWLIKYNSHLMIENNKSIQINLGKAIREKLTDNYPFSFVCLEKEIANSVFDQNARSTFIRTNEEVKKYFNCLRMYRATSICSDVIDIFEYNGYQDNELQVWGSTRYCFSSIGAVILSMSKDNYDVEMIVNKREMVYWFENTYVPILVLTLYYKDTFRIYSRQLENMKNIKDIVRIQKQIHSFINRQWLYKVSDDIQSSAVLESARDAFKIEKMFSSIRDQINESVSMNELKETSKLNKTMAIFTFFSIFFTIVTFTKDLSFLKECNVMLQEISNISYIVFYILASIIITLIIDFIGKFQFLSYFMHFLIDIIKSIFFNIPMKLLMFLKDLYLLYMKK